MGLGSRRARADSRRRPPEGRKRGKENHASATWRVARSPWPAAAPPARPVDVVRQLFHTWDIRPAHTATAWGQSAASSTRAVRGSERTRPGAGVLVSAASDLGAAEGASPGGGAASAQRGACMRRAATGRPARFGPPPTARRLRPTAGDMARVNGRSRECENGTLRRPLSPTPHSPAAPGTLDAGARHGKHRTDRHPCRRLSGDRGERRMPDDESRRQRRGRSLPRGGARRQVQGRCEVAIHFERGFRGSCGGTAAPHARAPTPLPSSLPRTTAPPFAPRAKSAPTTSSAAGPGAATRLRAGRRPPPERARWARARSRSCRRSLFA